MARHKRESHTSPRRIDVLRTWTFYWYGENKELSGPGTGIWHCGVRCYSSTDLYNWDDRGSSSRRISKTGFALHPSQLRTGRTSSAPAHRPVRVLAEDHEPYKVQTSRCHSPTNSSGLSRGSTRAAAAEHERGRLRPRRRPVDGKGYYYFERVHSELICADLTDEFTDVTGYYSTHFPHPGPPSVREAPAYFKRQGQHYLVTSGTTGYFPNRSELAMQ